MADEAAMRAPQLHAGMPYDGFVFEATSLILLRHERRRFDEAAAAS